MNWQHLIYFHKIVEAGSFSAASKQLYITSSALSKDRYCDSRREA